MTTTEFLKLAISFAAPIIFGCLAGHYIAAYQITKRKLERMTIATRMMLFAYEQGSKLPTPASQHHIDALQSMQEGAANCASAMLEVYGHPDARKMRMLDLIERELRRGL